jgi:phosphoglycerate dehydrogenase-like enzyme
MLLRGIGPATNWLRQQADAGVRSLDSTFVGGNWVAREPRGLTLGLIGLGAIGRLVTERAQRDGMSVIAFDPYVREAPPGVELVSLADLARRSHVVSVHAKATPETAHIVDAKFLAGLRAEAVLINTARQQLLDESALLAALQEGRLAGAALDVCEPEGRWPELTRLPQVICSPHLGGATVQTQDRGLALAVADIRAFLRGQALRHRVV